MPAALYGFSVTGLRAGTDFAQRAQEDSELLMTATLDIAKLAERVVALGRTGSPARFAVVVPLVEGWSEVAHEYLAEGPPFDPGAIGLDSHQVFLTEAEAIFVFESAGGAEAFERILAEPEFWDALTAWRRCAAGEPRLGTAVYSWPEHPHHPSAA